MRPFQIPLIALLFALQLSVALAADPSFRQAQPHPMAPQRGSTIPQLQLTPDYLYQQITALQQQVVTLQGQVNLLRSVVQISQTETTIQAENLSLKATKALALNSGKDTTLTVENEFTLTSAKDLLIKSGKTANVEGGALLNLKAPQVKLNNGSKPMATVGSIVSGGKVISGSPTIFGP